MLTLNCATFKFCPASFVLLEFQRETFETESIKTHCSHVSNFFDEWKVHECEFLFCFFICIELLSCLVIVAFHYRFRHVHTVCIQLKYVRTVCSILCECDKLLRKPFYKLLKVLHLSEKNVEVTFWTLVLRRSE